MHPVSMLEVTMGLGQVLGQFFVNQMSKVKSQALSARKLFSREREQVIQTV